MSLDGRRALVTGGSRGIGAAVAGVVAFLASADASYLTGTTVPIDGGLV